MSNWKLGKGKWSHKPKPSPSPDGAHNPLNVITGHVFRWIIARVGIGIAAVVFGVGTIWWHWNTIEHAPGVESVIQWIREFAPLPKASGEHFVVALAKLENDPEGAHRFLVREALNRVPGIEVVLIDRTLALSGLANQEDAKRAAHDRARTILKGAHAQVLIWGSALDSKDITAPLRVHWTVAQDISLEKPHENYRPREADYDLPELFWHDLGDILSLLAAASAAEFAERSGQFVADELQVFIPRVRALLASTKLSTANVATVQLVLADTLSTYGTQRGESKALEEAVGRYREALKERTQACAPGLGNDAEQPGQCAFESGGTRERDEDAGRGGGGVS